MRYWVLACLVCCCACGTPRVLAPRAPPTRQLPNVALPPEPPAEGYGRVLIDTTDGAMDVTAQSIGSFAGAAQAPRVAPVCRTPCVIDLPLGSYTLYFSGLTEDGSRGDVASLDVHPGLTVLRRAPGKYETPEFMPAGPTALVVIGIALLTVGPVVATAGAANGDNNVPLGVAITVVGSGLAIAGIATWPRRATQQDGTSTIWRVPPTAPASIAPASMPITPVPAVEPVMPAVPSAERTEG